LVSKSQKEKVNATVQEAKLFNIPKRLREALEGLEKEFKEYKIDEIALTVEAGIPSGFKGSVEATLKKKT
jgi:hypothetical protein